VKKKPTPKNSDWNLSFWVVALWSLIVVAIGFLAQALIKTMKARQPELRGIPQFDSGRWKLRVERVPVHPDKQTRAGMDVDSAAQTRLNGNNETHWSVCYQSCPA
jgi:hypothetical protein